MSVQQRSEHGGSSQVSTTANSCPTTSSQPRAPTALERRLTTLRWTAAFVLAGFLLNAGLVVLLISSISGSALVALGALGIMAIFVVCFALFAETFLLSTTGARALVPGEFPWLRPMVEEMALNIGIEPPVVLISDQPALNAYTTGIGKSTKIVFMAGLLESLSHDELRAVAAHELGHVVNKDVSMGLWSWAVSSWVALVSMVSLTLAALIYGLSQGLGEQGGKDGDWAGFAMMFFAVFLRIVIRLWGLIAKLTDLAISRQREHLADATAVAITRDAGALSSALTKIAENPSVARGAAVAGRFCIMSPMMAGGWWDQLTSTHPSPESRIKALSQLSTDDLPEIDADWRGIGGESWILPAGALGVLAILAVAIPALQ